MKEYDVISILRTKHNNCQSNPSHLPSCWSHIWVRLAAGSSLMSVSVGDREPGMGGLKDTESSLSELDLLQGQKSQRIA